MKTYNDGILCAEIETDDTGREKSVEASTCGGQAYNSRHDVCVVCSDKKELL